MGWGISIGQDADGYVFCTDADFETGPEHYEGYPPHSFQTIYENVEAYHSEIDFARDETGLDAARSEAWTAFDNAKAEYWRLSDAEKIELHTNFVKELKSEMKGCVVDRKRQKDKEAQIAFFKNEYGPVLGELEADITRIEKELAKKRTEHAEKRRPLTILEQELAAIIGPGERKKEIQKILKQETEWLKDFLSNNK
jgi:hypothetical protein